MGVPAFYRWLSEKYGKIVADMVEKRANVIGGTVVPVNLFEDNPNGVEFDNLYVDMNGLIHPCSHPEDREPPKTEEEMYMNVTIYLDRLMAAVRPRRLLYLAIDGVAPRAKMNQQRSRRFRAAQDAEERKKVADEVVAEMVALGHEAPDGHEQEAWDSNVITPGTEFMYRLSNFIRYYIIHKMNNDAYWKTIKVVFSDANEPGEGEHKIMGFIRSQRTQEGYDPNQHHILHGLDADLIMLALATHEAYFSILRERVTFGGGRKNDKEPEKSEAQKIVDAQWVQDGAKLSALLPREEWVFMKPLQVLHIYILREYLEAEFSVLRPLLSFGYDFERIIDDFIFLCFFVGNDFLPHLPSLDIRDGALDFLMECYREVLPSLGDYITSPGGNINLRAADVILAKVGEIEDQIFVKKKNAEDNMERRREQQKNFRNKNDFKRQQESKPPPVDHLKAIPMPSQCKVTAVSDLSVARSDLSQLDKNQLAAEQMKKSLLGKRAVENDEEEAEMFPEIATKKAATEEPTAAEAGNNVPVEEVVPSAESVVVDEILGSADSKLELQARMKQREHAALDKNKETVIDEIRFHEPGWKDRYYGDKHKKENVAQGGGLGVMCVQYIKGLCWVLKYYYEGVPSWSWYYPFHYAPFASDLVNIDSYTGLEFELATPFRPVEQLLAVLPANSAAALPEECRWLMLDKDSPIIDLYDPNIPIDPNGKHLPWLWILLLPFIDENRIHEAFKSCEKSLRITDRRKNARGGSLLYMHCEDDVAEETREAIGYECGKETDPAVCELLEGGDAVSVADAEGFAVTKTHLFNPFVGKGMCGLLSHPPPTCFVSIDATLIPPKDEMGISYMSPVARNKVVCYTYVEPEKHPHQSRILPGVRVPPAYLSGFDLMPRRPPRLNRAGFNMLDILNANRAARAQGTDRSFQAQHQRDSYNQGGYHGSGGGGRGYGDQRAGRGRGGFNDRSDGGGYHNHQQHLQYQQQYRPPQQERYQNTFHHHQQQQQQQQHLQHQQQYPHAQSGFGNGGAGGSRFDQLHRQQQFQQPPPFQHQQPLPHWQQQQQQQYHHQPLPHQQVYVPPTAPQAEKHDHNYFALNPNSRDPSFNRKATLLTGDALSNVQRRPSVQQSSRSQQHQQQHSFMPGRQAPGTGTVPSGNGYSHHSRNGGPAPVTSMDAIRSQLVQTHQQLGGGGGMPPPHQQQQQQQQQYGSRSAYGPPGQQYRR